MRYLLLFCVIFYNCQNGLSPFGGEPTVTPLPARPKAEWPTPDWKRVSPESVGISSEKLKLMEDYAFERTGNEEDRKGRRTDALLVLRNGKLIYEKYARNFSESKLHLTWSVSKSILQTLVGIAVLDGTIKLDDPGYYHYKPLEMDEAHKKITIRHLLNMSSGLAAEEGYESGPLKSTVIAMLYTRGRNDMGKFCASLPLRAEPGSQVYYSSCDTNILSAILKQVYGKEVYEALLSKRLFEKLGINSYSFEKDGSGTFVGSSYLYLTARDLAKIGYLYLNDGVWNGERLLPEGWVDFSRTPAPGYVSTPDAPGLEEDNYTAHWYANTGVPNRGIHEPWPDAPKDTFAAFGHWGQMLYVIPSLDIIVVRFGDDREPAFRKNDFLKTIKEAVVR